MKKILVTAVLSVILSTMPVQAGEIEMKLANSMMRTMNDFRELAEACQNVCNITKGTSHPMVDSTYWCGLAGRMNKEVAQMQEVVRKAVTYALESG